jgi:Cdc6-like AAA superfamily ATPase
VGLYGERGVGKTSLANVLAELFAAPDLPSYQAVLVNCTTDDTFDSLWRNIFRDLDASVEDGIRLSPEDIRHEVSRLDPPALIVIDELDRLEDDEALTALADTIKTLSDHAVPSTVVLVGVARSIGDLIGEHQSIVRALVQIEMPRMTRDELAQIIANGCAWLKLVPHPDAVDKITSLSEGLPHYTHLLGLHAGQRVVKDDRDGITVVDVDEAIKLATAKHTMKSDYLLATRSTQADTLYREVLLACALANKNQLGYFRAGAIRLPLEVVAGRKIDIPQFARHLKQFLQPERGSVLHREGEPRRYFYRFSDPMMQPYIILDGLSNGLLTDEQLRRIREQQKLAAPAPDPGETTQSARLF